MRAIGAEIWGKTELQQPNIFVRVYWMIAMLAMLAQTVIDESELAANISQFPTNHADDDRKVGNRNLREIYTKLGSPTYGNLQFNPQWTTAHGVAANEATGIPHVTVEYRNSSVYVTSTSNLTTVKLEFASGNQQSWSPSSSTTGTFQGSGSNAGKQVRKVWVKSWDNSNQFGTSGEYFDFTSDGINSTLKKALGLNAVTYPYPSGSWDSYIDWVESSSNQNADDGYRYKFGTMNLIVWWLESEPAFRQTIAKARPREPTK